MKAARSIVWTRWALLCIAAVLVPTQASAYIDPGTGSYLVQALVAAVAGSAMAVKAYWHNIKAFLSGAESSPAKPSDSEPDATETRPADE